MTRIFSGKADYLEQFASRCYDHAHPAFPESILESVVLYLSFRVSVLIQVLLSLAPASF